MLNPLPPSPSVSSPSVSSPSVSSPSVSSPLVSSAPVSSAPVSSATSPPACYDTGFATGRKKLQGVPNQEGKQTVIAGAGPAGLTAAWMLARRGVRPLVLEQDNQVGGPRPHGRIQGFPFRHRRSPLFHQSRIRPEALALDDGHRDAAASPPLADLLRRQVLRLPPQADERPHRPRHRQLVPGLPELSLDPDQAHSTGGQLRRLGLEPIRPPPLSHLLQDLHGKGLGDSVQSHRRAVGRAADQGALALHGDHEHAPQGVPQDPARSRSRRSSKSSSTRGSARA